MVVVQAFIVMLLLAIAAAPAGQTAPLRATVATFQGVALGQSADSVYQRFGTPLKNEFVHGSLYWTYAADDGNARVEVEIRKGSVWNIYASLYGLNSALRDPYRVALGDPESRVISLRGQPDFEQDLEPEGHYVRYGSRGDVSWLYFIHDGKVSEIELSAASTWDSWSYPVPTPAATPWPTLSLGSVVLGQSVADVRRAFGVPNDEDSADGLTSSLTYRFDGNTSELTAGFSHGVATTLSVGLRTLTPSRLSDPFGVALGDSAAKLVGARGAPDKQTAFAATYKAAPGIEWTYSLEKGKVTAEYLDASITVLGTPPPTIVAGGRDGFAPDKAIESKGDLLDDALAWEGLYLSSLRCDGQGVWRVKSRQDATLKQGGPVRLLSDFEVECTTTKRKSNVYFDHTEAAARDKG